MPGIQQTRRRFLQSGVSAGLALGSLSCMQGRQPSPAASPARPPNLVIIFADDMGYGDAGCYGNERIKTPNLDRMAAEGLKFTSFYSCAAVCTPSRAGLLTGRYQIRSGLTRVLFPRDTVGFPDSEISLAQALKPLGYATACIGKWHLGHLPQFLPTRHGFDRYFGIPYSNDMTPTPLLRNERTIEEPADQASLTTRYTEEAVSFIKENKSRPFFLYMPHTMPHVPLAVSDKFKGKSAGGLYGDVIEELDWSVGQVLAALKEQGIDQDTLVVFTSDNGPWLVKGAHGGAAGKFRDGKGTVFEGGIREPAIARWPGRINAGRVEDRPAITLDLFPTFVALAGGKVPADRVIDGKDLTPVLLGTGRRADEEFFFYIDRQLRAHRSGPWKLVLPAAQQATTRQAATRPARPRPAMLFNLDEDPYETTNVAARHPQVVTRLQRQIAQFKKTV